MKTEPKTRITRPEYWKYSLLLFVAAVAIAVAGGGELTILSRGFWIFGMYCIGSMRCVDIGCSPAWALLAWTAPGWIWIGCRRSKQIELEVTT